MAPKFVPRERKHRKIARQQDAKRHFAQDDAESNELEILPKSQNDIETRKRSIRDELRAAQPKMSSKKQKRLDKYIDTKLRKDDTLALIKRLEGRSKDVDRRLFQSTKKLGQRTETKKEALQRALELKRRELGGEEEDQLLFEQRPNKRARASDWGESDDSEDEAAVQAAPLQPAVVPATTVGAGLKTALQLGEDGEPIIKSRKRRKVEVKFNLQPTVAEEWTGVSAGSQSEASSNAEEGEEDDEISDSNAESEDSEPDTEDSEPGADDNGDNSNSDSDDDEDSDSLQSDTFAPKRARTSAFKIWAEQARNDAIGFTPSTVIGTVPILPYVPEEVRKSFVARPLDQEPLPEGFIAKSTVDRNVHSVPVDRSEDMQTMRLQLPIANEEREIMEAIFNNDVVVISGATGSGKTTQLPQFLYENGFGTATSTPGMIGITQPRRVAAVSTAKRVADEMGKDGKKVSYSIRNDKTVGKQTRVKFMTDGVLLREMSEDFSLRKYSAIVIDEAHERTVNTDILISLMSRCVKARRQLAEEKPDAFFPLKLIIMSATLRISDFRENSRLFSTPPPLISVEGRQFEVQTHWSRKTSHDFVEEAYKKVTRGHRKLPKGGMLVFLTGQQEIRTLAKRLKETFLSKPSGKTHPMPVDEEDSDSWSTEDQAAELNDDESDDGTETEDPDAEFVIDGEEAEDKVQDVYVLPLYSQLSQSEQDRVFKPPPEGSRLIVLATNVAETSLTIPGIRYVFDSGRSKERTWDRAGVEQYRTAWISKASANQRAGRAGRTGPGHCYRLFSSALYETFAEFSEPEIYRCPLESVVLQLKSMNISRIDNFPFPTPPERSSLLKAETLLRHLGALDSSKARNITKLGTELQQYPVSPRFAAMLRLGLVYGCLDHTVAMVAALDVSELLISDSQLDLKTPTRDEETVWTAADSHAETLRQGRRQAYNAAQASLSRLDFNTSKVTAQADALRLFAAMYEFSNSSDEEQCCQDNFLREKGVREAMQLREQLTHIVRKHSALPLGQYQVKLIKPTEKQIRLLKQIVAAGFIDQVAIRADCLPVPPEVERKPKRAIDVRYKALLSSTDSGKTGDPGDLSGDPDAFVYIHPGSILARLPANQVPRYIVYQRLQKSQPSAPGKKARVRMHPLTPVTAEQLSVLARGTSLLQVGKPLGKIGVLPSVGGQDRRECLVQLNLSSGEGGMMGWPLVTKKVVQKRVPNEGWVVEKWVDLKESTH